MKIGNDIYYVGVNDHQIDLFEGQYVVPNGMSYNSYVIMDEKIAVMDTVDAKFKDEWLENVARVLDGAKPDYLVVQHMEPDHAANIENFMKAYPDTTVVANTKTFTMMGNFFRNLNLDGKKLVVANGDSLTLGKHVLTFVFAPMVHWPEVMVTYDSTDKVLFSADGFGKFGALDVEEDWDCEARRYYIGIVGKYGAQVQKLLKAAATLDIQTICPLHGPILTENLGHYIEKYDIWSSYKVESEGVVIAYTSVYGNTKKAVELLAQKLEMPKDQIRKTLLLQVGPPGVKVSVVDVAKAVRVYNNPKYEKDTVFFLYTCPQDVLRMAEAGVPIKSVNIGGMAFKTGKTQITKAVSVDESDIAAFKKLHEMGIELEIRPVATDKKVDLMSKIEGIEG